MTNILSKVEKHQKSLNEHDRLASLFAADRFALEIERKRIIDENINAMCCSDEFKEKQKAQQKELDKILKGTGSTENLFTIDLLRFERSKYR